MRGNYPLTRAKLHAAALQLLGHPECRLIYGPLATTYGRADWDDIMPPTNIVIRIDANADPLGHLGVVVHELLHILLYPCFVGRLTEDYLEVAILAYEADLAAYINASPRRRALWEALIARKLSEVTDAPAS